MNKARVLAINTQMELVVEVDLGLGITVKRAVGFTGVTVLVDKHSKEWLTNTLKFKNVKLFLLDEGNGLHTAKVTLKGVDINAQMIELGIGVKAKVFSTTNYNRH